MSRHLHNTYTLDTILQHVQHKHTHGTRPLLPARFRVENALRATSMSVARVPNCGVHATGQGVDHYARPFFVVLDGRPHLTRRNALAIANVPLHSTRQLLGHSSHALDLCEGPLGNFLHWNAKGCQDVFRPRRGATQRPQGAVHGIV
jgi:hypothetical protein